MFGLNNKQREQRWDPRFILDANALPNVRLTSPNELPACGILMEVLDVSDKGIRLVARSVPVEVVDLLKKGVHKLNLQLKLPNNTEEVVLNGNVAWVHHQARRNDKAFAECALGVTFRDGNNPELPVFRQYVSAIRPREWHEKLALSLGSLLLRAS
ncbi:hypothetical protein JXA32_10365 [Candidatus Sumerlaeota bacterium]|nr:hypothetical protein [Candidatus Sumerlaeota bacterium]